MLMVFVNFDIDMDVDMDVDMEVEDDYNFGIFVVVGFVDNNVINVMVLFVLYEFFVGQIVMYIFILLLF